MTMSASSAAWRTGSTRRPAFCAFATDALVGFSPTIDVAARIRQIHGVGMALRSEADHGNFLILDVVQIRIFIVINLHVSSCGVSDLAI